MRFTSRNLHERLREAIRPFRIEDKSEFEHDLVEQCHHPASCQPRYDVLTGSASEYESRSLLPTATLTHNRHECDAHSRQDLQYYTYTDSH
jgi:hypothetical protein